MTKSIATKRLKAAREAAGFSSAAEAARYMGVNQVTYTSHENGAREYDREAAITYAKYFKVTPEWLVFGVGESSDDSSSVAAIKEIDLRRLESCKTLDEVKAESSAQWRIPAEVIEGQFRILDKAPMIVEVRGDWMVDSLEPTSSENLHAGDKLIVDTADNRPSPPGVFVVWDGVGLYPSKVEILNGEGGITYALVPRNARYERTFHKPDELSILGRVKAKVSKL
ncbi:LexA family transcriptional regulator [Roseibium sp.]|jgi:transcriptional regulator with XRE-family HTH domain|uniref:LexA family transcriptional regulator n=1 Tax=Roseibium sp. TaxID=1936156 RepID=UPI003BA8A5A8